MFKHLTQYQRYYIGTRIASFIPVKNIAHELNIHRSTIYRELMRNKNIVGNYVSEIAENKARQRRRIASSKKHFSKLSDEIKKYIGEKLSQPWSPEQISGRMLIDIGVTVSHETIYQYIRHDKFMGGKLFKQLAHKGKKYKYGNKNKTKIPNRTDISERPKIVEDKARIGDFEGDTIVGVRGGSKNCLLTLADRKSKFTLILRTEDKTALSIQNAMETIYDSTIVPFKTITYDNGTEFCNHEQIAKIIGCDIYFARPYRSCERGLNEHTNGLIRWFFPKKTDFSKITDEEIMHVQNILNNRPRKVLGYLTPNEVMFKHLNHVYRHKGISVAFEA